MGAARGPRAGRRATGSERPENRRAPSRTRPAIRSPETATLPQSSLRSICLSLVFRYPQVTWMAGAPLAEDFTRLENRLIYEAIAAAAATSRQGRPERRSIREKAPGALDPALHPHSERIMSRRSRSYIVSPSPMRLETRLKRLRQYNDRMWLQQCQLMIQEAQETGDTRDAGQASTVLDTLACPLPALQPKAEHRIPR